MLILRLSPFRAEGNNLLPWLLVVDIGLKTERISSPIIMFFFELLSLELESKTLAGDPSLELDASALDVRLQLLT